MTLLFSHSLKLNCIWNRSLMIRTHLIHSVVDISLELHFFLISPGCKKMTKIHQKNITTTNITVRLYLCVRVRVRINRKIKRWRGDSVEEIMRSLCVSSILVQSSRVFVKKKSCSAISMADRENIRPSHRWRPSIGKWLHFSLSLSYQCKWWWNTQT